MHWTEPASATDSNHAVEGRLWDAANQLWANAALDPSDSPRVHRKPTADAHEQDLQEILQSLC